ncbi:MAG: hypothetical protein VKK59_03440 [Vampirovibrionales bacterium]|jgi:hypothetical protein|nr:hypothetical protein [Vampirovibrionales bacterium]
MHDIIPIGAHPDAADFELDLRGLTQQQARVAVNRLLEAHDFQQDTRVLIRIEPADACEGETLFQPVRRELMEGVKRGCILKNGIHPVTEGSGFLVHVAGRGGSALA